MINRTPYELIKTISNNGENTYIYLNRFSLPTAFLTSYSLLENNLSSDNHFDFQNNLIKNIANEDFGNIFEYAKVKAETLYRDNNSGILLHTDNIKYDNSYIYYDVTDQEKIRDDAFDKFVVKNGNNLLDIKYTELYHNSIYIDKVNKNPIFIFLNGAQSLQDIISYTHFYLVKENLDIAKKYFEKISKNSYKIEKISGSHYRIDCNIEKQNQILLTTIPYSKNWKITVDGKMVNHHSIYNALLALPVQEGIHQIDIKYSPKGFWPGIILSIISLFMLIIFNKRNKI